MNKIRVLHLYPKINITCGISKSIHSIISQSTDNYKHYVFCLGGDGLDKYKKNGINILVYKFKKRGFIQTIVIFIKLFSVVKKNNVDIIHSHHRYFDLLASFISKFIKVKTITSVRSKVFSKKCFSYKAEILVACSNAIREHLINYFNIDQNKVKVIYNFINTSQISIKTPKSTLKLELKIDEKSVVVGFIGRFNNLEKGVDILLESFKKLTEESHFDIILLLIGDGEDKEYINSFINTNNINVLVLPPKVNILDFYNILDIVALPSRVEPFGNVAIEAGIMKKAFIGSDIDGLKEIIDNGKNGILVEKENIEYFTDKLRILIGDSELRIKLGEELYHKVMNNFTDEKIIPLIEETYRQIMIT